MRVQIAAAVVALGATVACQFAEDRYLRRPVAREEALGTWVMTQPGVEGLRYARHTTHLMAAEHSIVVRPDGSCTYRGFRQPARTQGVDEGYVTTECEWRLGELGHQALRLRLQAPAAGEPYFYFTEEKGQLLLWQYVDDPDAWKYVEYAKQTQ